MEPATYILAILQPQPEALWPRLHAALEAQGAPPVAFDRGADRVVFTADTAELILRARVADALETVLGHGERRRAFGPAKIATG